MAQLSDSYNTLIKPENENQDSFWSEELDGIPLKQRLKLLLASKRLSDFGVIKLETETPPIHIGVTEEDQSCDSQGFYPSCSAREQRNERFSLEKTHTDVLGEYSCQGTLVGDCICSDRLICSDVNSTSVGVEKVDTGNGVNGYSGADVQAKKIQPEISDDFNDDLDYVVLKERQRMLLSRKSMEFTRAVLEDDSSWLSNPVVEDMIQCCGGIGKKESRFGDGKSSVGGTHTHAVSERNVSDFRKKQKSGSSNSIIAGSSSTTPQCSSLKGSCQGIESIKSENLMGVQEKDGVSSSKKAPSIYESSGRHDFVSGDRNSMLGSTLTSFATVKVEPLDNSDLHNRNKNAVSNFPLENIVSVKKELETLEESYGDELDDMLLRERMKLLSPRKVPNLDISQNFKCSRKIVPSAIDSSPILSEPAKPLRIIHPRKRRKTATDSVETALEEDAPGLLQVLIDKGVSINEMKLYGEMESDDSLEDSFSEGSFTELEAVMSKLCSQRPSLLKFAPVRCVKGEKASYCLACLISLVEQARYLQFRKWPVEWGWCRDLQSFIFVFERHNRIVLERPEYGYATYFFELVDSLPIDWQVKRLVTAMKLTNCGRVTLIENKALVVGKDLTEGEARVLTEYGWVPNTGLGTMLNYCDRVVHDRKNEIDSSEWRSKIGKLLVNGYSGGSIVLTDIPKSIEHSVSQSPQIKLEF
ncbi:uncharacterized protein LOC132282507 isoform X2 [Cornus florida]|uniref:uncharacterized protein LOC132282507 isoform X2 n=1 Tax=Cornus florida TaxID=4283 RepID=UPI0028A26D07|nr:uncharacterized protein LOC132282507 isoform X2 [Cornus florida]